MAISKTDFINYSRCPRYAFLDKVKKDKLEADISIDEYKNQERNEYIEEMLGTMYEVDDEGNETDLIDVPNRQLEAMMEYYKQVELETGRLTNTYFGGKTTFSESTYNQECFDFNHNGVKYLCYVDVYNENEDGINIIEVKATTTNMYKKLGYTSKDKEFISIFQVNLLASCGGDCASGSRNNLGKVFVFHAIFHQLHHVAWCGVVIVIGQAVSVNKVAVTHSQRFGFLVHHVGKSHTIVSEKLTYCMSRPIVAR